MKAKVGIWMPLFIGDYLSDTMHLTTEQHGAYLLIIMAYWKNGGELPGATIQAITRLQGDAWSNAQAVLGLMFSIQENGNWRHDRIERELEDAGNKKQGATAKAKAGAAARWGKANKGIDSISENNAPSIAQAVPEQCPSPSPSPNTIKSSCDQQAESPKAKRIPLNEIFEAYARCLPALPQLRIIDEPRKAMIRSRWNADEQFQSVEFWERFFTHVSESDFLMGRTDRPWTGCCFDWLLKPANFRKIVEGNYDNA